MVQVRANANVRAGVDVRPAPAPPGSADATGRVKLQMLVVTEGMEQRRGVGWSGRAED